MQANEILQHQGFTPGLLLLIPSSSYSAYAQGIMVVLFIMSIIIIKTWGGTRGGSSAEYCSRTHTYFHCTYDDEKVAQHGAHTGQPMQCSLQFAAVLLIHCMHAIWYWRSISKSNDSCQNSASADLYHMNISQAQV